MQQGTITGVTTPLWINLAHSPSSYILDRETVARNAAHWKTATGEK